MMPEFLKLVSLDEAKRLLFENLPAKIAKEEVIETSLACGRVMSQPVVADEDLPAFTRAAMDGFAVNAADTHGASESLPVYLSNVGEVKMGEIPAFSVRKGQAAIIHTGGMLPEGVDSVVMMEYAQTLSDNTIEITRAVTQGENILLKGEDVRVGDIVIESGIKIRPEEIGGLLALGKTRLAVYARPLVHIFSNGDELIPPDGKPKPGQVRNINSGMLASYIEANGGIPVVHPIVPDNNEKLENAIRSVVSKADLIIITAGSSASARDMTASVINRFGNPGVLVHGIHIRPGKPTILAVCGGKPMIGLPGNPVSAMVISRLVVKPLLERMTGQIHLSLPSVIQAKLAINLPSVAGRDDFLPAIIGDLPEGLTVTPIFYKSNLIFSLTRANGLIHIPADVTGYSAGDLVNVYLI